MVKARLNYCRIGAIHEHAVGKPCPAKIVIASPLQPQYEAARRKAARRGRPNPHMDFHG